MTPETICQATGKRKQMFLTRHQAIEQMNQYGKKRTPFFFLISYDTTKTLVIEEPLNQKAPEIAFDFPQFHTGRQKFDFYTAPKLCFEPPSREQYAQQFHKVQDQLHQGNIYLLNLTRATPVHSTGSLTDIYQRAKARYKILVPGQFVVFSPETFIRIHQDKIYTHPMKGTIRADDPDALARLRNDTKEKAEHASIVDLLRNDLGQVAQHIQVKRFRYFEKVNAGDHQLWQASSEIKGSLAQDFHNSIGDLLFTLLPAGSITGVPKKNAVDIIRRVENYERGFYTGIGGYFDGQNLDSCVLIRFIEETPQGLVYKSGGGIHQLSDLEMEYNELIEKIYVPVY